MEDKYGLLAKGCTDDGANEFIISSQISERTILNVIKKMYKITPASLQAALSMDAKAEKITVSRSWTPLRTVLELSAGPLALLNVKVFVTNAELSAEDLFLRLPALRHLVVYSKSLLEERRDLLDVRDCSSARQTHHGRRSRCISRPMFARLYRFCNNAVTMVSDNKYVMRLSFRKDGISWYQVSLDYYQVRRDRYPS